MIDKYYEEELRYLYDSGREFARAHPDRARFLNVDAVGDRDPYVERLFEGFAFLAARIREKIDDSFPELTEGLLDLLWPHLLQEIPSMAIVEFKPRRGFLQESRTIARGAEMLTGSVGPESAVCRFTTTQDVVVHPIALEKVDRSVDTKGRATLAFRFQIDAGIKWPALKLSPLRLYLHAEMPTALMLHEFLTGRAVSCTITSDGDGASCGLDPSIGLRSGGLDQSQSLLPFDTRTFWGYSLLREYFVFPEKFLFVDLHGFEGLGQRDLAPERLTFSVTFDRDLPPDRPFRADTFRLFCSPAANIFRRDTEPVACTGLQTEYRVVADSSYPQSVKVHSVVSVTGTDRITGERSRYEPFHTFRAIGRNERRTYAVRYRDGAGGARNCHIALGGRQLAGGEVREENLSVEAWCTNGTVPREDVRENGINKPGAGFPDYVVVANITRPTLPLPPPKDTEFLWMFLSQLGVNYSGLASADTLRSLLRLYNWSGDEARTRRIEAITEVVSRPVEKSVGGSVVRGVELKVSLAESEFRDSGEMFLFGEVLKEFLAHYVSINSFVELVLVLQPSGAARRWSSLRGRQWLI